ncbi:50S ribosomal protein L32 [Candidatus Riflebacteria bacterium]
MGALPKNKISRTRKRKRRTHYKLKAPTLSICGQCGSWKRSHHVCPNCGYYGKNRKVFEVEA